MLHADETIKQMLIAPARKIKGKVELYNGSALLNSFAHNGALQNFTVDKMGDETKFFGFGVAQKLTVNLLDKERAIEIEQGQELKVCFEDTIYPCPSFFIDNLKRNENTNQLEVVAFDAIQEASKHTLEELVFNTGYTIEELANAIANLLGLTLNISGLNGFDLAYPDGANFDGGENLRDVLDDIAEATQTIYYINSLNELVFARLNNSTEADVIIDKANYFTMSTGINHTLNKIVSVTELGDNIHAEMAIEGVPQYIRDNAFLTLRDDLPELLQGFIETIGGLSIATFNCKWRGNFLLEPCDKIGLITKDNSTVYSYVVNSSYTYSGGYSETIKWEYKDNNGETASTPNTLGEVIKQTTAKVDKVNQQIELVVKENTAAYERLSQIELSTDSINASVQLITNQFNESMEDLNEDITQITNRVNQSMTAEELTIEVQTQLQANGASKVVTSTGYKFDDEGLTISKEGNELSSTFDNDGLTIKRNEEEVLDVNSTGVYAQNLHATTYLIIGKNSRLEDAADRTACYWIGG